MNIKKRLLLYINMILFAALLAGCSNMLDVPNSAAAPGLRLNTSTGGYSVPEDAGTIDINISLARRPSADVTFTVSISDPAKATITVSSLTFTNSNWDNPQTVTVTGVGNFIADRNKNVSLWFGAAVSSDPAYVGFVMPSIGIIVIDNETPSIVVSPAGGLITTEESGVNHSATFTVVLSSEPTGTVTIPTVVSSDTSEGTVDKTSLIFTTSNWSVHQVVTITGVDDIIYDHDIDYDIQLGTSSSTDPDYDNKTFTAITVTNIDDELPVVVVTPTVLNLSEGTTGTFTVRLGNIPTGTVTIPVSISNTLRGSIDKTELSFNAGNYSVPQTVTVTAIQNYLQDGNVTATVVLGVATGYNDEDPEDVTVNISDNDTAGITASSLSRHTTEGGQNATFTVKLTSQPASDVTVAVNEKYQAANDSNQEGTIDKTTLTFTSVNWNTNQTVTVTGVDDEYADGNKSYLIRLTSSSSDSNYTGKIKDVAVVNDDDDFYGLRIVANGSTTNTGNTAVTISGFATDDMNNMGSNYANFTIRLGSKPASNVTITFTSGSSTNDGSINGAGSTTSLTFNTSNWSTPQSVAVTGASNGVNEGGHDYTISTSISSSDTQYGSTSYVAAPRFSIFSCDNDVSNLIAYCRKSGGLSTSESGGTATFWLLTKTMPVSDESVPVTVSDKFIDKAAYASSGVDSGLAIAQVTSSATATITGANYNTLSASGTNKIVVRGNDDGVYPFGGTYFSVILGTSSSALSYDMSDLTLLNSDNDQVVEAGNASGDISENGTTATFGVRLKIAPESGTTVTFTVSAATATEGIFTSRELTFTDANYNVWQSFTVTGVNDNRVDGKQSISMTYTTIVNDGGLLDNCAGGTAATGIFNLDNDKLIWITETGYFGNMNTGVVQADIAANTNTDANYPSDAALSGASYKALIADGVTRRARTTSTGNTGQLNWVLQPNTEYYLKTGSYPYATRIFTTDANGIPGAFTVGFTSSSSDHFWTGFNADWTTSADTCGEWKVDAINGTYGIGGTTGSGAISSGTAVSNGPLKKIIAVQQ